MTVAPTRFEGQGYNPAYGTWDSAVLAEQIAEAQVLAAREAGLKVKGTAPASDYEPRVIDGDGCIILTCPCGRLREVVDTTEGPIRLGRLLELAVNHDHRPGEEKT